MGPEPGAVVVVEEQRVAAEDEAHRRAELRMREAETELKRAEAQLKMAEAELRRSEASQKLTALSSPLTVAVIGAALALLGNIYTSHMSARSADINARSALEVERVKAQGSLLLEALRSANGNAEVAKANLLLLKRAKLVPHLEEKAFNEVQAQLELRLEKTRIEAAPADGTEAAEPPKASPARMRRARVTAPPSR